MKADTKSKGPKRVNPQAAENDPEHARPCGTGDRPMLAESRANNENSKQAVPQANTGKPERASVCKNDKEAVLIESSTEGGSPDHARP